ncbi:hypothetical protein AMS68_000775 [Peltaster fructicola]|uniref:Uncharacterized protein n=1 Tax=Peltaster fructicola TaxID=286661 RepID=A0A6H0XKU6_9PEZI|nr:hypothetical protein AMS68_000775 [Peltaster fructicola]
MYLPSFDTITNLTTSALLMAPTTPNPITTSTGSLSSADLARSLFDDLKRFGKYDSEKHGHIDMVYLTGDEADRGVMLKDWRPKCFGWATRVLDPNNPDDKLEPWELEAQGACWRDSSEIAEFMKKHDLKPDPDRYPTWYTDTGAEKDAEEQERKVDSSHLADEDVRKEDL